MADTGTGTDPTTDRCPDCGHPAENECGCFCCGPTVSVDVLTHAGRTLRVAFQLARLRGQE